MKEEKGIFCAVIVKPREDTKEKINMPREVQQLLEKYHEILDNGLPNFSPMREVSH